MKKWKIIVDVPEDEDELEVFQAVVALNYGCVVTLALEEEVK